MAVVCDICSVRVKDKTTLIDIRATSSKREDTSGNPNDPSVVLRRHIETCQECGQSINRTLMLLLNPDNYWEMNKPVEIAVPSLTPNQRAQVMVWHSSALKIKQPPEKTLEWIPKSEKSLVADGPGESLYMLINADATSDWRLDILTGGGTVSSSKIGKLSDLVSYANYIASLGPSEFKTWILGDTK